MITNIELNDSGAAKWNEFFFANAGEAVKLQATTFEMMDRMLDAACCGESLVYELGARYTNTGRPVLFSLDLSDIELTEEADE